MNNEVSLQELRAKLQDPSKIKTVDEAAVEAQIKAIESQQKLLQGIMSQDKSKWSWDKFIEKLKTTGTVALMKALSNALNTLAYDTATWLGSGGKGQKPMFITEGWDKYLSNVADNAAGTFIEKIGKEWNFNLCEPDFALKIKIGLGLVQQTRPEAPACTFSKMKKNWEKELKSGDFLTKFQDMFEPTSSELGIALSLQSGMGEGIDKKLNQAIYYRQGGSGWSLTSGIDEKQEMPPGEPAQQRQQIGLVQALGLTQVLPDPIEQAANVFLNQLAITLFNNMMKKVAKDAPDYTSRYEGDYGLGDYDSAGGGGKTAAEDRFREILEPKFNVRGDYDILAELTMCPDPTKAGPTNCVITDKFRQAISVDDS